MQGLEVVAPVEVWRLGGRHQLNYILFLLRPVVSVVKSEEPVFDQSIVFVRQHARKAQVQVRIHRAPLPQHDERGLTCDMLITYAVASRLNRDPTTVFQLTQSLLRRLGTTRQKGFLEGSQSAPASLKVFASVLYDCKVPSGVPYRVILYLA